MSIKDLSFDKCQWICALLTSHSENVWRYLQSAFQLHLKLSRRIDNFHHVCSVSDKSYQSWKGHFIHRALRVRYSFLFYPCTGPLVSCQDQLDLINISEWDWITIRDTDGEEVTCSARRSVSRVRSTLSGQNDLSRVLSFDVTSIFIMRSVFQLYRSIQFMSSKKVQDRMSDLLYMMFESENVKVIEHIINWRSTFNYITEEDHL